MGAHPIVQAMMNGADLEIDGFERAESGGFCEVA